MSELPWVWLLIRATGVTAFLLLTAVMTLGLLLRTRALTVAPPALLAFHRTAAATTVGVVAIHMTLLLVDPTVPFTIIELLVPFSAAWRPVAVAAGIIATWLLLGPLIAHRLRTRFGQTITAAVFTRVHIAAYGAWPLAAAHFLLAGTDARAVWAGAVLVASAVVVTTLLGVRGTIGRRTQRRRT